MELSLKKAIVFFDLETTGLDITNDRIVEISLLKITPDGSETIKTRRLNPQMPIPAEATAIHGITDADVADAPTFAQVARSLANLIGDSDLAGFNSSSFDVPMLAEEFARARIDIDLMDRRHIDVKSIYHKKEERTLSAACRFYLNREHTEAHGAESDVMVTYEVLKAQLDKYDDLQPDTDFLSEFSSTIRKADPKGCFVYNNNNEIIINFGKHRGKSLSQVLNFLEPNYYEWMMKADFPTATKAVLQRVKQAYK